jgi:dihydroxyacetone kinase-like protein
MKQGFQESKGKVIVESLIEMIHENRAYLSEIDGAIGDGDHGINMDKGFSIAKKRLEGQEIGLSESCKVLGNVLVEEIGGSMGPLYGIFFKRIARVTKGNEIVDVSVLVEMLNSVYEGITTIGNAKVGDKTLIDTLVASIEELKKAQEEEKTFNEAVDAMISGAEKGWHSTKDLVAKVGRASRLGERSKGVLDAGATSCYLILQTMGNKMKELSV